MEGLRCRSRYREPGLLGRRRGPCPGALAMGAGAPSGRRCQWVFCTCLDGALDAAPIGEGPPSRLGLRHPAEWMAPELAPLAPVGSPRAGGLSAVLGLCGRLRSAVRDPLVEEPRNKRIERQIAG